MRDLLHAAADHAADYLEGVDERPVHAAADYAACVTALGGALPEGPTDPRRVLDDLVTARDPGITGMNHPRFFGFVIGGHAPGRTRGRLADVGVGSERGSSRSRPSRSRSRDRRRSGCSTCWAPPADSESGSSPAG